MLLTQPNRAKADNPKFLAKVEASCSKGGASAEKTQKNQRALLAKLRAIYPLPGTLALATEVSGRSTTHRLPRVAPTATHRLTRVTSLTSTGQRPQRLRCGLPKRPLGEAGR